MKPSVFPFVPALWLGFSSVVSGADPAWWSARGVKNSSTSSNLSPATIGQAKHMVAMAMAELQLHLAPPVFAALQADVASIVNLAAPITSDDYENQRSVLLVGQLKALSAPFYRKFNYSYRIWLNAQLTTNQTKDFTDTSNFYPWTSNVSDDSNKAIATVGQLKAVFALRFEDFPPVPHYEDNDEMDDAWELDHGFDPTNPDDASGDADGDGISNLDESEAGTDPYDPASGSTSGLSLPAAPVVTLLSPPGAVLVP